MIFKDKLLELNACGRAVRWAGDRTIEQIVAECERGDWLLWLAAKLEIGLKPLTLAKGHCANTVRHLMKDERSVKAVDTAIAFGEGKATEQDLTAASAAAAYYASYAAASAAYAAYAADSADASYAAASAAYAAYAADSADADADAASAAADSAYAAAYAAAASYASYAAADAKKENQRQTADICRKYIGDLIINKVNNDI